MAYVKNREEKKIPLLLILSFFALSLKISPDVPQELQGETRVAQAWAVQLNYQDLKETRVLRQHL